MRVQNLPKLHISPLIIAAILITGLLPSSVRAFPARVVWVTDGDTITVLKQNWSLDTIRIYGLDCPEKDQPDGFMAHMYTLFHLIARKVEVGPVERDRYGRLVARIAKKQQSFNAELIRAGHAWVYDRYCQAEVCDRYRELERKAKKENRGLWANKEPIPPWRWRRGQRPDSNWRFW